MSKIKSMVVIAFVLATCSCSEPIAKLPESSDKTIIVIEHGGNGISGQYEILEDTKTGVQYLVYAFSRGLAIVKMDGRK